MDEGASYHAPIPIIYGNRPAAVAIAASGDTLAIAYEDPNSATPAIGLALSKSQGHLFERKGILASARGARAERPLVAVQGSSERVHVRIDWVGGGSTTGEVTRSIAAWSQLSTYPQLCARVSALTAEGWPAAAIAERLQAEGLTTVRAGRVLGAQAIRALQHRLGLARRGPRRVRRDGLGEHEWWPAELARRLALSRSSLYNWIQRGWVRARQLDDGCHRWVIWADTAEVERLHHLQQRSRAEEARRRWQAEPGTTYEARPPRDE